MQNATLWKILILSLCFHGYASVCVGAGSVGTSLGISLIDYNVFRVSITSPPTNAVSCSISAVTWNGAALSPPMVVTSDNCFGTYTMNGTANSLNFGYGVDYSFYLQGFDNTSALACSTNTQTVSPTLPQCGSVSLTLTRPDSVSVGVLLSPPFSYGLCRILIDAYKTTTLAPPISTSGACNSEFVFSYDRQTIVFQPGDTYQVYFAYYDDGVNMLCDSSTAKVVPTVPALPDCHQSLLLVNTVQETYYLEISPPTPFEGTCFLIVTSCDGFSTLSSPFPSIQFPSCSLPVRVTHAIVSTLLGGGLVPGSECHFSWKYVFATQECVYGGSPIGLVLRDRCGFDSIDPVSSTFGSIVLSPPSLPTLLSTSTHECWASLVGCDNNYFSIPLVKNFPCANSVTFSTTDSPLLGTDSDCEFQVTQAEIGTSPTDASRTCSSPVSSFPTSLVPNWSLSPNHPPSSPVLSLALRNSTCVTVSWPKPAYDGGSPLLCYQVWRGYGSPVSTWLPLQECGQSASVSIRSKSDCGGFHPGQPVTYKTVARNRNGPSTELVSQTFQIQQLWAADPVSTTYVFPPLPMVSDMILSSLEIPQMVLRVFDQPDPSVNGGLPVLDSVTSARLFVAQLKNPRCKISSVDSDLTTPLVSTDSEFVSTPNIATPPVVFTQALSPADLGTRSLGQYVLQPFGFLTNNTIPMGNYSLVVSALQPGGLGGKWFSNPFFAGSPAFTQFDPEINFNWGLGNPLINRPDLGLYLFDLVSVRWTGWIESPLRYPEKFTFLFETFSYFTFWLDDVKLVDYGNSACVAGVCTTDVPIELNPSPVYRSASNTLTKSVRMFHSIRIDFHFFGGLGQDIVPQFVMKWNSSSVPLSVVPMENLFSAKFINNAQFLPVQVVPDILSTDTSIAYFPTNPIIVAGTYSELIIQGKDAIYQNITTTANNVIQATFKLISDTTVYSVTFPATEGQVSKGASPLSGNSDGIFHIPFVIPLAGNYTVTVTEVNMGSDVSTVVGGLDIGSGYSHAIQVVAAVAASFKNNAVAIAPVNPSDYIAGNGITVSATLLDSFGNVVLGVPSSPSSRRPLWIAAEWLYDTDATVRLGTVNDIQNRTMIYGTNFQSQTGGWDALSNTGYATIVLPNAGTYRIAIGIVQFNSDGTPVDSQASVPLLSTTWQVFAQSTVEPVNTVIITVPHPPLEIVAGNAFAVVLQLRDQYMNSIVRDTGDGYPIEGLIASAPVRISVYRTLGDYSLTNACAASTPLTGQFKCTIDPTIADYIGPASHQIYVSITVNRIEVYRMPDQTGGPVSPIQGPFQVSIAHSVVNPLFTIWAGIPVTCMVGVSYATVLYFRDTYGNLFQSDVLFAQLPTITVLYRRGSDNNVMFTVDPSTYVQNSVGTVTVIFSSGSPSDPTTDPDGWIPELYVNSVRVPIDATMRTVFLEEQVPDPVLCFCDNMVSDPSGLGAGSSISRPCLIKDSFNNVLTNPSLVLMTEFTYSPGTTKEQLVDQAVGVWDNTSSMYIFTTTHTNLSGTYSVLSSLGMSGGAVAQYFSYSNFYNLILENNAVPPPSSTFGYYTRIDEAIGYAWDGNILINGVIAQSVRWNAKLQPPIAATYRFTLAAIGGVMISIDGAVYVNDSSDSLSTTFDIALDPTKTPFGVTLIVEYVPSSNANLSLLWAYPDNTSTPFEIHPDLLLVFVPLPPYAQQMMIAPGEISALYTYASVPKTSGVMIPIQATIYGMDSGGNPLTINPSRCPVGSSTTLPDCLFLLSTDATSGFAGPPPYVYDSGTAGQFTFWFSFADTGPINLYIKLAESNDGIVGSPYSISITI